MLGASASEEKEEIILQAIEQALAQASASLASAQASASAQVPASAHASAQVQELENEIEALYIQYKNLQMQGTLTEAIKIKQLMLEKQKSILSYKPKLSTEISKYQGKIFALSDIHGDLHAFIIALRDCAKVIQKKQDGEIRKDPKLMIDPDIETNLRINIELDDNGFNDTFNYEWCGGNSFVVICGDIIDPYRDGHHECKRNLDVGITNCTNYPQIEIKLLRFINTMNDQASRVGGKIFKILGNHEYNNIYSNVDDSYKRYRFDTDEHNYRGTIRKNLFNYGNHGYELLFKDGCYSLLKINNTIFTHGELPMFETLKSVDLINNLINYTSYLKYPMRTSIFDWLENRLWSNPDMITSRIHDGTVDEFCTNDVKKRLQNFMGIEDIDSLRVVLGHCIQSESIHGQVDLLNDEGELQPDQTWKTVSNISPTKVINIRPGKVINKTFNNVFSKDDKTITYDGSSVFFGNNTFMNMNTIFGITMQCGKPYVRPPQAIVPQGASASVPQGASAVVPLLQGASAVVPPQQVPSTRDFFIYHVDIGSSRAFDLNGMYSLVNNVLTENQHLFSRTPQLLSIDNTIDIDIDHISIIKSKMKNTRIHQPRPNYEENIRLLESQAKAQYDSIHGEDESGSFMYELSLDNPRYEKKYLKYKQKYLLLKEKLKNL